MLLYVKVRPGSRQEKVEKLSERELLVSVKERAIEGRANTAVIESLSRYLDKPKSRISIIKGHKAKIKTVEVICFFCFFILGNSAFADTIYLKNDRQISGVISREDEDSVELTVKNGTLRFFKYQIARITRSAPEESNAVTDSAEEQGKQTRESVKKAQLLQRKLRNEIPAMRLGNSLIVNALINDGITARLLVDTGVNVVVLSRLKAKELGIVINKEEKPNMKVKLPGGGEIEGKFIKLGSLGLDDLKTNEVDAVVDLGYEPFKDFDGYLGMSYLKYFEFEVNLSEPQLILQERR